MFRVFTFINTLNTDCYKKSGIICRIKSHFENKMKISSLIKFCAVSSVLGLTACSTVSYLDQKIDNTINRAKTAVTPVQEAPIVLTQNIANQLKNLNNEVVVKNILYVSQDSATLDGKTYTLLRLHTTDNKVYHTRVESSKITTAHFEQLKKLKGATFIGVIAVPNKPYQYFFKNFKDIKY